MKTAPRIGAEHEIRFTVEPSQAIVLGGGKAPPVLSTPSLVWFLEHAALEALLPFQEEGEASVGVHLDIRHLAATPVGDEVICKARIVYVEGAAVSFQVDARDSHETILRGSHKRQVVDLARFARRVARKQ